MKTVLRTATVWMLMAIASYAQNPAAMAIRSQIEQQAPQAPKAMPDPADEWRQTKKLTLLDEVPESPRGPNECLSPAKLEEGSVGYLECWPTVVTQIAGPKDVLLAISFPKAPLILLTEYSTKGLARGEQVRLVGPVEVLQTKPHPTPAGNRVVRVVRLASHTTPAGSPAAPEASPSAAVMRTWTDAKGKFSVEARFIEFKSGEVRLQREGGKTITVAMARLSQTDQKWIRDELARRARQKRQSPEDQAAAQKALPNQSMTKRSPSPE